jgi:MoxR-like ATPase
MRRMSSGTQFDPIEEGVISKIVKKKRGWSKFKGRKVWYDVNTEKLRNNLVRLNRDDSESGKLYRIYKENILEIMNPLESAFSLEKQNQFLEYLTSFGTEIKDEEDRGFYRYQEKVLWVKSGALTLIKSTKSIDPFFFTAWLETLYQKYKDSELYLVYILGEGNSFLVLPPEWHKEVFTSENLTVRKIRQEFSHQIKVEEDMVFIYLKGTLHDVTQYLNRLDLISSVADSSDKQTSLLKLKIAKELLDLVEFSISEEKSIPEVTDYIIDPVEEKPLPRGINEEMENVDDIIVSEEEMEPPDIWWVNQGETSQEEIKGEFLWAPLKSKDGKSLSHWENLIDAREKDIVINYSRGKIYAISVVTEEAIISAIPKKFPEEPWIGDGYLIKIRYFFLKNPISLNEIPVEWRVTERNSFNRNGGVNQGYFYPLSLNFVNKLTRISEEFREKIYQIYNFEFSETEPSKFPIFSLEFYTTGFISDIKKILMKKKQIILYGPPGTGKTHLAIGLAQDITNELQNVHITQFHPSFGYEDFLEGIKVETISEGKGISYEIVPKIFRQVCERATQVKQNDDFVVLIIDEINRGDLGRIFGELVLGLEYRNIPLKTVYMNTPLIIPDNLLIIGTMNSVDRSIAIVDFALRRRFRFFKCMPESSILKNWLDSKNIQEPLKEKILNFSEEINSEILKDEKKLSDHYQIGHVFFFVENQEEMIENWKFQIRPLLEEYLNFNTILMKDFDDIFDKFNQ